MTFGTRCNYLREVYGITQHSLADLAGVRVKWVREIEHEQKIIYHPEKDELDLHADYKPQVEEIVRACKKIDVALEILDDFPHIIEKFLEGKKCVKHSDNA